MNIRIDMIDNRNANVYGVEKKKRVCLTVDRIPGGVVGGGCPGSHLGRLYVWGCDQRRGKKEGARGE